VEKIVQAMIYDNIHKKLSEMQREKAELRKVFNFSMEKLQDTPGECLAEISDYLETYKDKIEDYYFKSYVDESTFQPVLVMHVIPTQQWRNSMQHFDFVGRFFDPESVVSAIRLNLEKIFSKYLFEINDKETRLAMSKDMERALIFRDFYPSLVDITTDRDSDAGSFKFLVNLGENEMSIGEYLKMISES
jgi:hypothetical protein